MSKMIIRLFCLFCVLIVIFSFGKKYSIEEKLLENIYQHGEEYGLDIEHEYSEYKKFLIADGFLDDDTGVSYYKFYENMANVLGPHYFDYNFLDTIKYHCNDTSIEFKEVFKILNGAKTNSIKEMYDIDYKKSKQFLLDRAMDSLAACGLIHPSVVAKLITKILRSEDFEQDYYKMKALLTIAITADVVPLKPKSIIAPNDALQISLDSVNCIYVMDEKIKLNELRGIVYKYLRSDTKTKSLTLRCSTRSSYEMYVKLQDEIGLGMVRRKKELALLEYGKNYDELDADKKELVDKECSVKIIELEPQ